MANHNQQLGPEHKRTFRAWLGPLVLGVLGSTVILQGAIGTQPWEIIMQGQDYNAGTVKAGVMIHHVTTVFNLSPFTVQFTAQPGCGCTVLDVSSNSVGPFSRATIKSSVDTFAVWPGARDKLVYLEFLQGGNQWRRNIVIHMKVI